MLYENYQKKMERLAAVLSRLVRLLPLILTVLGISLGLLSGYLLLKGTVFGWSCSPQITYGEPPEYSANAFFAEVRYEYREADTDGWQEGIPTLSGLYTVRPVSTGAFGGNRYGKALVLEILPREISVCVTDTEALYGSGMTVVGDTVNGDRIACDGFAFRRTAEASDGSRAQYDVTPDISRIRILDTAGNDVTRGYRISAQTSSVSITKLDMTLTVPDASAVYDGEAFRSEHFEITDGNLCEGDTVRGNFPTSLTDVGSAVNEAEFRIFDGENRDVTEYYRINCVFGTLTVEKRPLAVTTGSAEAPYSGEPLCSGAFTVDEASAPVSGHTLLSVGEAPAFTEAGTHPNVLRFRVIDESGADVSDNYDIRVTAGEIRILPRSLTVTTESAVWQYDGKPHTADNYTFEGLPADHTAEIFHSFAAVDVGEYTNEILFLIRDGKGKDVTDNYAIEARYGTCRITPRPISFVTKSKELVYDGTSHYYYGYTADGLAESHNAHIIRWTEESEAGVYTNVLDFMIGDAEGRDVTFNYTLSVSYGTLTIGHRPLYLTTPDAAWTYDGGEHREISFEAQGAAENHEVSAASYTVAVSVGNYENATKVKIVDASGVDVSENYEIIASYGTLTVEKREITVRTASAEWVYDGMAHGNTEYSVISETGLTDTDTLVIRSASTVTNVGKTENIPLAFDIVGDSGTSASDNYGVTWEYGELAVTPRPLSVKPAYASKIYDGQPLYASEWELGEENEKDPVPWHTVEAVFGGEQTEVGEGVSTVVSVIIRNGTEDVTENYAIATENGVLRVLEKPVSGEGTGEDPGERPGGESGDGSGALIDNEFSDIRGAGGQDGGTVGRVKAETSDVLYLRRRSYGDFADGFWMPAPAYEKLLPGGYNYHYLTSAALANYGLEANRIEFADMLLTLLPYYTTLSADGYTVSGNDVSHAKQASSYRAEYCIPSARLNFFELDGSLGEYTELERAYAAFVYRNYLSVDEATGALMARIIEAEGFSASDPYVIKKIALYIKNAAGYNTQYDPAMNEAENVIVAFLEEYKEGGCSHFASAATLLFRTLGIPARYVEGYRVETVADKFVEITGATAHAWVEVYVDGVGWVQVEVTGGFDGTDGGSDNLNTESKASEPQRLTVEPNYQSKVYDGTPLSPESDDIRGNALLTELLGKGYRYEALVSGAQTEVGQSESVIESFRLFDPKGKDVTALYEIECKTGILSVLPAEKSVVRVYLYQLQKYYDGKELAFTEEDYGILAIEDGATLSLSLHIGLTDVGYLSLSDLNADIGKYAEWRVTKDGTDVTERFVLEFAELTDTESDYVPIRIDPRMIEVTAGSASKLFDGEPLTCEEVRVSFGTLAEGHRISAETKGEITAPGEEKNEIVSVRIYNEKNENVTDNYRIVRYAKGVLTVLPKE